MTAGAAIVPVAAAAAGHIGKATALASQPVIWSVLGEPFEAASMIAALFGCFAARFWIGAGQQLRQQHRWMLDAPVSGIALALTAGAVLQYQPVPFTALLYGAGIGMIGEGIFKFAERVGGNAIGISDADAAAAPAAVSASKPAPAQPARTPASIQAALRKTYPPQPLPDDLAALSKRLDPTSD